MKVFVSAEHAFHKLRRILYAKLNERDSFRKATLRRLGPDVVWLTKMADDHVITFSPHEVVGKHIYRYGQFERGLTDRVLAILSEGGLLRGRTALEVGANIGTQSIYLMLSGHFDRIVCIEPEPRNFALLRRNLADNGFTERAIIVECAVGNTNGEIEFHIDDVNHGASGFTKTTGSHRSIAVPLRRVDDLLDEAGIDPTEIGFIWMDIEGAEPEALRSMEALTARRVPILMEFSPRIYGLKTADLVSYLSARYDRCVFFTGGTETPMSTKDIPHRGGDVLLF